MLENENGLSDRDLWEMMEKPQINTLEKIIEDGFSEVANSMPFVDSERLDPAIKEISYQLMCLTDTVHGRLYTMNETLEKKSEEILDELFEIKENLGSIAYSLDRLANHFCGVVK
jgi:hypothetical protein